MADSVQDIRSTFLDSSARFYSYISPSTSAYLMQQKRQNTTIETSKAVAVGTSDVCASCDSLILPGLNSRCTISHSRSARRAMHKKKAKGIEASQQYLKVECLVCHRYTKRPLEKQKAHGRTRRTTKTTKGSVIEETNTCGTADTAIATPTPTRKQRKRNRTQGGLQAMIEKSKQASKPSGNFDMDLMDFMKLE